MSLPVQMSQPAQPAAPEQQQTASQFQAAFANIQQQHEAAASPDMPSVGGAPQLIEGFGDQRVGQGDSVIFSCVITGNPKPKVSSLYYEIIIRLRTIL